MTKEIADAFGLQQDSLERVADDEHPGKAEHCQSCSCWAKKYAEHEAALSARNESNQNTSPDKNSQWDYQDFCL